MKASVKGLAIAVLLMAVAAVSISTVAAANQTLTQAQAQTGYCQGDQLMTQYRYRLLDNGTCVCADDGSCDQLRLMVRNGADAGGDGIMQRDRDRTCQP